MNKQNLNPNWIGYYFGQSCILHPETGRWVLTGYFSGLIECKKNIGLENEDVEIYPISEVQFCLKRINPFLFASMSKFYWFIKTKALEGYWMNFESFNQIVYEG